MKRKPQRRKFPVKPAMQAEKYIPREEMPSYKKWEVLSHFITDRGKILPRTRTGLNARKQRVLTREIKRARHLALLPYVVKAL